MVFHVKQIQAFPQGEALGAHTNESVENSVKNVYKTVYKWIMPVDNSAFSDFEPGVWTFGTDVFHKILMIFHIIQMNDDAPVVFRTQH